MIQLQYPEPDFRIKEEGGKHYIFDNIRKSWVMLTEEEWVRQNILAYLIRVLHYPSTLIAIEKEIQLNDLKKRFDILVYNKKHQPWMMIECKEPKVPLSEEVLQQVLRYNMSMPVEYIVITNGDGMMGWRKKERELKEVSKLPELSEPF